MTWILNLEQQENIQLLPTRTIPSEYMSDYVQSLCSQKLTTTNSSKSFFRLPSELRNTIFEYILLRPEPINPWDWYGLHELTLGLLFASKSIHAEASLLFYSGNRFDFCRAEPEKLASFLRQIGIRNAGCIQDIIIDFPAFLYLDPGNVTIHESNVNILAHIQSSCGKLSTLTTSLQSTTAFEDSLNNLEHHNTATQALDLVNTRFEAISSLRKISLEVYEDGPSDHIRRRMESYGWTLNMNEYKLVFVFTRFKSWN